jgi:hypothetical protein
MNVFRKILDALSEADVDFVIIGGVAARRTDRHGSPLISTFATNEAARIWRG